MVGKIFYGKAGIKATVLAYSINQAGQTFLTFEIEYPRLVLAEFNTHRALSRNSFSSRAVPFDKMLENLSGHPVRFGANQGGMQDKGEDHITLVNLRDCYGYEESGPVIPQTAWRVAKKLAISVARAFHEAGYHKQVYNRLLEPFQMMKTIVSGTEWGNFFWLRDDGMTDPTLAELARVMREAKDDATPVLLQPGEWHLPYIDTYVYADGRPGVFYGIYVDDQVIEVSLEDAIMISCARCAAVSYRNEGYGIEKSRELYERLVGAEKKHASALEHCATPMQAQVFTNKRCLNLPGHAMCWEPGISHADRDGNLWSGNLKGFIQHRKLIPGENYED